MGASTCYNPTDLHDLLEGCLYLFFISYISSQSKALACQQGIILAVCQALEDHAKLSQKTANELIKLLEVLASHSITPYELKHIFLLIKEDADLKVS
jgi:hypothetical protein